jgi:hypothetical protein
MRWRKISQAIVEMILEKPDKVEDKGSNDFN